MFSTARPTMTPSYTATGHYASGLHRLCRCKGSRVSRKFSHLPPTRSVCTNRTPHLLLQWERLVQGAVLSGELIAQYSMQLSVLRLKRDNMAVPTVQGGHYAKKVLPSHIPVQLASDIVEIALPEITTHEIPKKVHVHVVHLRNTLPHKLTPYVLTEVRPSCEPLDGEEEVVVVKTDGNHKPPPSCSAFSSSSMSCDTARRC